MDDLEQQIRGKLTLHDTGESSVADMRCTYDCEMTQSALLAVLEVIADPEGYPPDCECLPCVRKRIQAAVARALGIEVSDG